MIRKLKKTFISFKTQHIADGKVLWISPRKKLTIDEILNNYSWVVAPATISNGKTFYADIYGGGGNAGNGGSGRAGFDGKYQVKGIGQTPLVSRFKDKSHSDGAICVFQSMCDALWGEVLSKILPYGAVTAEAIIQLPLIIDNPNYLPGTKRALLVRNAPVRLAHFERSLYYKPSSEILNELPKDFERVQDNFLQLDDFLDDEFIAYCYSAKENDSTGNKFIIHLIKRIATQLAYCHAGMLKLATSSSNITINGCLLDFNSCNVALPNIFKDRQAWNKQLEHISNEWKRIAYSLCDLSYLWNQYRSEGHYTAKITLENRQILDIYSAFYHQIKSYYLLCKLGINKDAQKIIAKSSLVNIVNLYEAELQNSPETLYCENPALPPITCAVIKMIKGERESDAGNIDSAFIDEFLEIVRNSPFLNPKAIAISTYKCFSIYNDLEFHNMNAALKSAGSVEAIFDRTTEKALFNMKIDEEDNIYFGRHEDKIISYHAAINEFQQDGELLPLNVDNIAKLKNFLPEILVTL